MTAGRSGLTPPLPLLVTLCAPSCEKFNAPSGGTVVRFENGLPVVPSDLIIPVIRGDGSGVDIWPATHPLFTRTTS